MKEFIMAEMEAMNTDSVESLAPAMPANNEFDQETARRLLRTCATLIVERFPVGSEFGMDLSIHYTGERFLGLKMVPPGLHFVHVSFVNQRRDSVAPRIGFFHHFESGECLITKWDAQQEDLMLDYTDVDQAQRFRDQLASGQLDSMLGAYQFETYQSWVSLTDYISVDLFRRLNPECRKIYSASNLVYRPNETGQLDRDGLPDMVVAAEAAIRFVSKPPKRMLYPESAGPDEITRHSIDSSYTLAYLIDTYHQGRELDLLGELQFAFICFLLGHVYEAFEFWTDLLRIICSAQTALAERTQFYLAFIRVAHFQLKQTEDQIFADIVENENRVYHLMRTFFVNLRSQPDVAEELRKRGQMFQASVEKSLDWRFEVEEEPDDEKPVVVLTEDC